MGGQALLLVESLIVVKRLCMYSDQIWSARSKQTGALLCGIAQTSVLWSVICVRSSPDGVLIDAHAI